MRGCLSAELAELHGLRTKGNEEIRAWMTRRFDEWTPKYQEFSIKVPRRCLFVGTSNPSELFEEYERRWLPITIGAMIDTDGIERDRDLLWAEAAARWTAGGVAWRAAEELLREEQGAYRVHDTWEEALNLWARGSGLAGVAPLEAGFTTREAMIECLAFSDKSVKRADEMRCANALKQLGFVQKVQKRDGRSVRVWVFLQPLQPLC
jgi:predicted P-loop ATPase